jgi:hypothetical protein
MRLLTCAAILLACAGCRVAGSEAAPAQTDPVVREAREKFTFQGKPILPYFLHDFAGGPGAPDMWTVGVGVRINSIIVDGLRLSAENDGAYAMQATWQKDGAYGFNYSRDRLKQGDGRGDGYAAYKFVGTTPGGTTVLEYVANSGGSAVIHGVMLVRFNLQQTGATAAERKSQLVMQFLQVMCWGDRITRDVRLEGNKLLLGPSETHIPAYASDLEAARTIVLD